MSAEIWTSAEVTRSAAAGSVPPGRSATASTSSCRSGTKRTGDRVHLGLERREGVAGAVVGGAGDLLVETRADGLGRGAEPVGLADDRAHRVEGLGDELRRLAEVEAGGVEQVDQAEQPEQLGQRAVEERRWR